VKRPFMGFFVQENCQCGERPAITISGENQDQMLRTSSSPLFFKDPIGPQPKPPGLEVLVESVSAGNGAERTGSITDALKRRGDGRVGLDMPASFKRSILAIAQGSMVTMHLLRVW
jgi:hypothetical protein